MTDGIQGGPLGWRGIKLELLRATGSCHENKNKSWDRRVRHLQQETTPLFLPEGSGGKGRDPLHGSQGQGCLLGCASPAPRWGPGLARCVPRRAGARLVLRETSPKV